MTEPRRTTRGLPARRAAHQLLTAVLDDGETLDDALDALVKDAKLAARDRAFAHAIAATTLRRLGEIDHVLAQCLDKPLPAKAVAAQRILQAGVAELLFLEVKPHAAVGVAVDLAGTLRTTRPFKPLINAVLRRVTRERDTLVAHENDATRLNVPAWLWESWQAAYGDEAEAIAVALQTEAPLDLTPRDPASAEALAGELGGTLLATGSIRLTGAAPVADLPGFKDGRWWVQDAAASLPALLLGDIAGEDALDLCAAPGGKTLQLAAGGASVTALDRARSRLARIRENLARTGLAAELVAAEVLTFEPDRTWPVVLLDAPCSATGTARRHPDVLHLKTPEEVQTLVAIQREMLAKAAALTAPGGRLVYCVCSLQPEEGEAQIDWFLESFAAFRLVPADSVLPAALHRFVTARGSLRTLPTEFAENGGMDGFFAALLERT